MKFKVAMGALAWALLLSVAHVHLNVGWPELVDKVRVMAGVQRPELIVGFLPVT